jgi:polyhydroxyalkanoate synthesis regulator phasin
MRTRLLGLPLAGLLLIGGATAVLAQSGTGPAAVSAASGALGGAGSLLHDVLSDLVGEGTITEDQADAITEALEERRTELREHAEALRERMREFLEDEVLTEEELAQLPEDHPLRNLDRYLEDGQITVDELRELGRFGHGFGRGGPGGLGGHHGLGPGLFFEGGPDMSPNTDSDTDTEGSISSAG